MLRLAVATGINFDVQYPTIEEVCYIEDHTHMSRVMRKPAFCICENEGANQLGSRSLLNFYFFLKFYLFLFSLILTRNTTDALFARSI